LCAHRVRTVWAHMSNRIRILKPRLAPIHTELDYQLRKGLATSGQNGGRDNFADARHPPSTIVQTIASRPCIFSKVEHLSLTGLVLGLLMFFLEPDQAGGTHTFPFPPGSLPWKISLRLEKN
jgi:hypothetical protein